MITTGTPVSIAVFEWLTWYANQHVDWFERGTESFNAVNTFLVSGEGLEQPCVQNFIKLMAVFLVAFDGGIFATNVHSLFASDTALAIQWTPTVRYELAYDGWDRGTRQAVDYIVRRAIGFDSFVSTPLPAMHILASFLRRYQSELTQQLDVTFSLDSFCKKQDSIREDLFVILSAFPILNLNQFYAEVAEILPDEFYFEGHRQALSAKSFFLRPVTESMLVLDKVKMHYNLHFHSTQTLPFLAALGEKTTQFVASMLAQQAIYDQVNQELQQLQRDQLSPKLALLTLVMDHYRWPS
ncbi:MAG: hypothetical protein VW397_07935 [Candidatus Margulisiibacteriota bacterium]